MWGPMMGPGWDGTMGWWMMLTGVLFWGALLIVAVWAVRQFTRPSGHEHGSALAILEERFARGELSKDQFEEMKRLLVTG